MKCSTFAMLAGALMLGMSSVSAMAAGKTIAVSWKTFQEERWKIDEAAIKEVVEAAGNKYVSTDAQLSAAKQLTDIEGLVTQKVDVILVVAFDSDAILPAFQAAADAGVKMISYDVLVEDPDTLYITFDNVGVGRLMAKEILKVKPEGDYAFIKGDKADPNATFLFEGIMEVLEGEHGRRQDQERLRDLHRRLEAGRRPEEHGAVPDLREQQGRCRRFRKRRHGRRRRRGAGSPGSRRHRSGLRPGWRPCCPQPRGARHPDRVGVEGLAGPRQGGGGSGQCHRRRHRRLPISPASSSSAAVSKGVEVNAILIPPNPITKANLNDVIDGGWVAKEKVCAGVAAGSVAACN